MGIYDDAAAGRVRVLGQEDTVSGGLFSFAYVYDIFMDNTPYDKWGGFVLDRLRRAGIQDWHPAGFGMRYRKYDGASGGCRL